MIAIFAHRGWSGGGATVREITTDALAAARRAVADGVELDVRMAADGHLVVHHDACVPEAGRIANIETTALPGWVWNGGGSTG